MKKWHDVLTEIFNGSSPLLSTDGNTPITDIKEVVERPAKLQQCLGSSFGHQRWRHQLPTPSPNKQSSGWPTNPKSDLQSHPCSPQWQSSLLRFNAGWGERLHRFYRKLHRLFVLMWHQETIFRINSKMLLSYICTNTKGTISPVTTTEAFYSSPLLPG